MNERRDVLTGWLRISSLVASGLVVCAADIRPAAAAGTPIKVSCIGEQTTHSDLFPSRTNQPVGMQEYPAMLQTLLGSGYNVMNYGDCCASVISGYTTSETHPYISGNQFAPSISFAPDIVVIGSWGRHDWGMSAQNALAAFKAGDTTTAFTKFQTDYDTLVSKYIAAASKPKIFCSTPIPIPFGNDGPDDGYMTSPAATAIKAVCAKYNLPIIDLFTIFTGHKEYYINPPNKDSDGEHTSTQGAMVIAQAVFNAITGIDGGVIAVGGSDGGLASGSGGGSSGGNSGSSSGSGGLSASSGSSGGSSSGAIGTSSGGVGTGAATGSSGAGGSSGATSTGPAVSTGMDTSTDTSTDNSAGNTGVIPVGTGMDVGGSSDTQNKNGSVGCNTASGLESGTPWGGAGAVAGLVGWALLSRRRRNSRRA